MQQKLSKQQKAKYLWPLLVDLAKTNETVGYRALSSLAQENNPSVPLKLNHHFAIAYPLGVIQQYCIDNQLPMLTALVINVEDECPGESFAWDHIGCDDSTEDDVWWGLWEDELKKVRAFDWESVNPNFGD